jgi:ATP-binding cassette subfamily C protein LapB
MGKRLFDHLLYADLSQFERNTAGTYLDKFNSAESIKEYYCGQNLVMLVDLPFIVIYLGLMFFISPYIALVPTVIIIYMIIAGIHSSNLAFKSLESKTDTSEIKSKFLIEMLAGIHTIKALGMEEQFLRRYERLHQREILGNYELIQRMSESSRSGQLYSQLAVILTVTAGGITVINHLVSVGGLAASILLTGKLMLPVTKLVTYIEKKKQLSIAKDDLEFINSFEPEYAPALQKLHGFTGEVKMENVSFKYPGTEKYIFKDVNLHIMPNETVVIHGPAFSGKSSLILLISSLYKINEGKILIDGVDLKEMDLDDYRHHLAYMSEHGELFNGTILENLTLFEPEKYAAEAKEIAKVLGLHDIIEAMPQAYDTIVGTGTVDLLSKGHKQMILIIRTLIDKPKLILFDEANLALDIDSDIKLRKYLMSLKGKCTLVLATHRPSLIEMADKHYKLSDGKLTEFQWK